MLAIRPGTLTRLYIDGHRTRYVSPLALFLFMIVTMFFIASLTSGKAVQSMREALQAVLDAKAQFNAEMGAGKARVAKAQTALAMARARGGDVTDAQEVLDSALQEGAASEDALNLVKEASAYLGLGNFTAKTGWKVADVALLHAAANKELTFYKLKSAGSKSSFLLVPITLPFLWLLFCRRRDIAMYDHAVFALYSLSFTSLMFSLAFVLRFAGLTSLLVWMVFMVPPVHMYLQLRGTYTLAIGPALWRTGALMMIAAMVFLLYLLLILLLKLH